MIAALKSEFRKLLTVRSTYVIFGLSLLLAIFYAGFIEGVKGSADYLATNPGLLASESRGAILSVGFILAFAGLLLVGHEYRYTSVMYSLTSQNRRYKVLLAKFLAVTAFALLTGLFITFFAPLCTIIGAAISGHEIGPQVYNVWDILWRCMFISWGYAMFAFFLVAIMRNQIGAIVTFLLVPLVGENILTLLLKDNAKYLPFRALQSVGEPAMIQGTTNITHQAMVVLVYVAIGLVVSFVLFSRRDAN
jgi:ABC-type transport system involved in multi-copper enzyme maturation permease subunit